MKEDVAIIGMSGLFPGAADIAAYWNNIINKVNAITDVPANRISNRYFEAGNEGQYDRFYCTKGGFVDEYAHFNPYSFGILPLAVEGMEPDQLLALQLAHQALADAGVWEKQYSLHKTAIIIGKGNYVGPGATRAVEVVHVAEQLMEILQALLPNLSPQELDTIKKEFQAKKGRFSPDTAMGLIPNLVASLVANRLNLGGAAYTIDGACASSLLAIDHAVNELFSKRSDMVIAGGIHVAQNATFWSIFHQLGALSKQQKSKPFDQDADGLIIGEGCGFVVLKTLTNALKDQDKIYCVIKGVGVSSDGSGTSVMNPSVKGQVKAIEQAWSAANLSALEVGYIEAHGTATPVGDRVELETLKQFFGSHTGGVKAKIGSVKSMIGHTMPAAGIAGLIKTALALYHDILPPTINCDNPIAAMNETRFEPVVEAISWSATGLPLRAGVNAFGFGGINAHIVLEAYKNEKNLVPPAIIPAEDQVLLLARNSVAELTKAIENKSTNIGDGVYRIAVFHPTEERLRKALNIVKKNIPWRNRQDIWYSNAPLLAGNKKIAFLFPGLDGLSIGETDSIAHYFGIEQVFLTTAIPQEKVVLNAALKQLQNSVTIDTALKALGIMPAVNAGHSLGEWLAGLSAGLVTTSSIQLLLKQLDPELFEVPQARFIAVGTSYENVKGFLATIADLYLANDNCPQQVILCGSHQAIDQLIVRLKAQQIFHQILPFQSGFHSPFIQDRVPQIIAGIETITFLEPKFPIWSATTLSPYPDTIAAIRQLNVEHLISPVQFRSLIEKLYHEENVAVFIQIGSGSVSGFVDDTLKGCAYNTLSASSPHRNGIAQLRRVLASLYVEGRAVDLNFLGLAEKQVSDKQSIRLNLGVPLIDDWKFAVPPAALPRAQTLPTIERNSIRNPISRAVAENMEATVGLYTDLIQLLEKGIKPKPQPTTVISNGVKGNFQFPLAVSLSNHPYLIDHALVKQRKGWHCPADMDPVIPMTMIIELLGEIAQSHSQALVISLQQIKVFQWMNVSKPFQQPVMGSWINEERIVLSIPKYTEAQIVIGKNHPTVTISELNIGNPLPLTIDKQTIYERHMFHGPAYQGIESVTMIAKRGISGWINDSGGKGSLLDNAGQLFGLWLQLTLPINKVAFPIKIEEIKFFQDFKNQSGTFECFCQLTHLDDAMATADFLLKRNGKVWAHIKGWQNIRLEFDERLWQVSMSPRYNLLSEEIAPGVFYFNKAYQKVISWDFIAKRYLPLSDRTYLEELPINRRKQWLISRVAVRDAIRSLLLKKKNEAYFPIEFSLTKLSSGQPVIEGPLGEEVHISIAHKNDEAVGIAQLNKPVGIDIEEIKSRGDGFNEMVLTANERFLLKDKKDFDEWVTRFWVAKEAYGKSIGKGLAGNPKGNQVEAIEGTELLIKNVKIKTIKFKNYIIGWTL